MGNVFTSNNTCDAGLQMLTYFYVSGYKLFKMFFIECSLLFRLYIMIYNNS